MNTSERVSALEALLGRIQRNAGSPKIPWRAAEVSPENFALPVVEAIASGASPAHEPAGSPSPFGVSSARDEVALEVPFAAETTVDTALPAAPAPRDVAAAKPAPTPPAPPVAAGRPALPVTRPAAAPPVVEAVTRPVPETPRHAGTTRGFGAPGQRAQTLGFGQSAIRPVGFGRPKPPTPVEPPHPPAGLIAGEAREAAHTPTGLSVEVHEAVEVHGAAAAHGRDAELGRAEQEHPVDHAIAQETTSLGAEPLVSPALAALGAAALTEHAHVPAQAPTALGLGASPVADLMAEAKQDTEAAERAELLAKKAADEAAEEASQRARLAEQERLEEARRAEKAKAKAEFEAQAAADEARQAALDLAAKREREAAATAQAAVAGPTGEAQPAFSESTAFSESSDAAKPDLAGSKFAEAPVEAPPRSRATPLLLIAVLAVAAAAGVYYYLTTLDGKAELEPPGGAARAEAGPTAPAPTATAAATLGATGHASSDVPPAPTDSASAATSASAAPSASGAVPDGKALAADKGYLLVTAPEQADVLLNGVRSGITGAPFEVDCSTPKYISLAKSASNPAIPFGRSKSSPVICQSVTTVEFSAYDVAPPVLVPPPGPVPGPGVTPSPPAPTPPAPAPLPTPYDPVAP